MPWGNSPPNSAQLNDDVLFGEVWSREDRLSSLRDRSVVTVVALMAQGLTDSSFRFHLMSAKSNGVTRTEIAEILTHAAFYAGWPKAWAAFRKAKEVWATRTTAPTQRPDTKTRWPFHRCPQRRIREVLYRAKLPRAPFHRAGRRLQRDVRARPQITGVHHAKSSGGQILVCVAGRGFTGNGVNRHRSCALATWSTSLGCEALARSRARPAGSPISRWRSRARGLQRVVGL